jgi:hypothetical protein
MKTSSDFLPSLSNLVNFILLTVATMVHSLDVMLRQDRVPLVEEFLSSRCTRLHPFHVKVTTWIRPPRGPFDLSNVNNVDCVSAVSRLLLLLKCSLRLIRLLIDRSNLLM